MIKLITFLLAIHGNFADVKLYDSYTFYKAYNAEKRAYSIELLASIAYKESRLQTHQVSKDGQDFGMFQIRVKFYKDLKHLATGSKEQQITAVCEVLNRIKALTRKSKRFRKKVQGEDLKGCVFRWIGNYNFGYGYYKRICNYYLKIRGKR